MICAFCGQASSTRTATKTCGDRTLYCMFQTTCHRSSRGLNCFDLCHLSSMHTYSHTAHTPPNTHKYTHIYCQVLISVCDSRVQISLGNLGKCECKHCCCRASCTAHQANQNIKMTHSKAVVKDTTTVFSVLKLLLTA